MRKVILVVLVALVAASIFGGIVGDLHKKCLERGFEFFTYMSGDVVFLITTCGDFEDSFLMLNYEADSFSLVVKVEEDEHIEIEFLHYTALYGIPKEIFLAFVKLEPGETDFIYLNERLVWISHSDDTDKNMMVVKEN